VHFTFELSKASKVILVSKVSKVTAVLCLVLWMFAKWQREKKCFPQKNFKRKH
jgi:hypothetical protein